MTDGETITVTGTTSNNTTYTVSGSSSASLITLVEAPTDETGTNGLIRAPYLRTITIPAGSLASGVDCIEYEFFCENSGTAGSFDVDVDFGADSLLSHTITTTGASDNSAWIKGKIYTNQQGNALYTFSEIFQEGDTLEHAAVLTVTGVTTLTTDYDLAIAYMPDASSRWGNVRMLRVKYSTIGQVGYP